MMNQRQRAILIMGVILFLASCATKQTESITMGGPEPLKGFSKNPTEEVVQAPHPTVVAKAEPGRLREVASHPLADIYFAFDRWGLSEEGRKYLTENAESLKQHPEAKLVIEGYCDERGSHEYNLVLGEKRAQETMLYLSALGIKIPVKVISYGKERQVCTEQDESCYWKNRRAHMVVESVK
ncbi:MAG TPA: OmpA family protein [Nitrospiraceae bacterium]|nr:OmpA family protein [Nitrospiraceae bacterium]